MKFVIELGLGVNEWTGNPYAIGLKLFGVCWIGINFYKGFQLILLNQAIGFAWD